MPLAEDRNAREGELLRVLMVTPCYYPVKGGTETMVRNLSLELNKTGIHTDVMTFNMTEKWKPKWRGETKRIDNLTVFRIPALNWQPLEHSLRNTLGINLIAGRFTNIMRNYDIVHFHEFDLTFPLFSFFVKRPKIFHLHGLDTDFLTRYHLSRAIFKNSADLFIAISKRMKTDLIRLGNEESKVVYLPNGIDVDLFSPKGEKEDNLILFVGRISFEKGLHVLLKSLHHLRTTVRLVVIGPFWDDNYFREIKRFVTTQNLESKHRIELLGALDPTEIVKWYRKASLLVLPSFREGLPVVLLEALSCEIPVVVTPVGGVTDIVKNHRNGLFVPRNNTSLLAEKIQYLLDNKELRVKLGHEGRKDVIKNFSLDAIGSRLRELYERILTT